MNHPCRDLTQAVNDVLINEDSIRGRKVALAGRKLFYQNRMWLYPCDATGRIRRMVLSDWGRSDITECFLSLVAWQIEDRAMVTALAVHELHCGHVSLMMHECGEGCATAIGNRHSHQPSFYTPKLYPFIACAERHNRREIDRGTRRLPSER